MLHSDHPPLPLRLDDVRGAMLRRPSYGPCVRPQQERAHAGSYSLVVYTTARVTWTCATTATLLVASLGNSGNLPYMRASFLAMLLPPVTSLGRASQSLPSPALAAASANPSPAATASQTPGAAKAASSISAQTNASSASAMRAQHQPGLRWPRQPSRILGRALRTNAKFYVLIEKSFADILTMDKKSQILPHTPEQKRKFAHDLAAVHRTDTQVLDREPHRSVQLI
ncbi:hypothetical protein DICSQDRAFT_166919 [Dichomitus squalens LYAD-421 SS1]|uniref:uncharacterized protein n=1 Tax=Dichomitus squalens (strain LYAD-421) TaxID=732165 RepID=UPI00044113C8|nr:uncharacterized protein DICSQDRAFT_166919 [Dichomitus squalens LYAD-421 SS1]EJF64763.1 hypothetical protein DICSQDRAFT_166919 [Dichomitus squalens LYAD-421 SS1]